MARIIYYNKSIKIVDRILAVLILVFMLIWIYTKKSISPSILLTLGLQQLLYAFNCYKLRFNKETKLSLSIGITAATFGVIMLIG